MSEKKNKKQICFDLETKALEKEFGNRNTSIAYNKISNFFRKEKEFEHTQYSVYTSLKELKDSEIFEILLEFREKNPWIKKCLKGMSVTDAPEAFDITKYMKSNNMDIEISLDKENSNDKENLKLKLLQGKPISSLERETIKKKAMERLTKNRPVRSKENELER